MMLGLPAVSSGAAVKRKGDKKRAKSEEKSTSEDVTELVAAIGKMALQTAHKSDIYAGILLDCLVMSEDCKVGEERLTEYMKKTMREYADAAAKLPADQKAKLGPPHLRAWSCLVTWAHKAATAEGDSESVKKMEDHKEELAALPSDEARLALLATSVKYCRLQKAYHKGTYKLEVSIAPLSDMKTTFDTWTVIRKFLVTKMKAEMKQGKPPASVNQRKVVTLMKEMGFMQDKQEETVKMDT
eukprot:TRINITY_DN35069_c0_g1_i1.p3 TRINITY_DN35069_c0_g1~~TRINITY_DN35069_c0_g1_i1.p3  ORF type:complete len:242 (-),score=71.91 TRINITY_DN35069_c0_g1_i1:657-1382(-)